MENSPTLCLVPTGIGCEVGGFAGDALPTAKLLASASGCLITVSYTHLTLPTTFGV